MLSDNIVERLDDGKLMLRFSKEYYLREAIFAAAYKFTDKCAVKIEPVGEVHIGVILEERVGLEEEALKKIAMDFANEALDQQVRLDLEARNGRIRELIVRHAFSPISDLESEINDN